MATRAARSVWWASFRQILPLLIMLPILLVVLIGFLLVLGEINRSPNWYSTVTAGIGVCLVALPSIYAVGLGGMLVGREKETLSIDWFASLPVPASTIVGVKLLSGLAGLAGLWGLCGGLLLIHYQFVLPSSDALPVEQLPFWILYSIYLAAASLALSWFFNSSTVSLFALVPAALLPAFLAGLAYDQVSRGFVGSFTGGAMLVALLVCLVVALAAQWIAGRRYLAPQKAQSKATSRRDASLSVAAAGPRLYQAPNGQAGSMLWQQARQNRGMLLGCNALIIAAVLAWLWLGLQETTLRRIPDVIWLVTVMAGVACCWLGSVAFLGDAHRRRMLFLADRGVSPSLAWWTRHAVPVGVLLMILLVGGVCGSIIIGVDWRPPIVWGLPMLLLTGTLLFVYAVGQWTGQVLGNLVVAAAAGPVIAAAAIYFLIAAYLSFEAPLAVLVLAGLVPWAATWGLMRRWLEDRRDLRFGLGHAGGLVVFLVLPTLPLGWTWLTRPGIAAATSQAMLDLARQQPTSLPRQELVLGAGDPRMDSEVSDAPTSGIGNPDPDASNRPTERVAEPNRQARLDQLVDQLSTQLRSHRGPLTSAGWKGVVFLQGYATFARHRDADESEAARLRYRRAVEMLDQIAARLRQSGDVRDQDHADFVDIWLLREASREQAAALIGDKRRAAIVRRLADRESRRMARRRAIALSWEALQRTERSFGGWDVEQVLPMNVGRRTQIRQRGRIERSIGVLWALTEPGTVAASPQQRRAIAEAWHVPPALYGLRPSGKHWRADRVHRFAQPVYLGREMRGVASQWNAGWETEAIELDRQITQPQESSDASDA